MGLLSKINNRLCSFFLLKKIKKHGKLCSIGKGCDGNLENVFLGDSCHIGRNNIFLTFKAEVRIGNYFMSGPNVVFITGNHRTDIVGKPMEQVTNNEKKAIDDQDIVIMDDVWIGANAIILKGITIGEGSIVGAGSVVTKDVEPYTIVAGNPAKKIKPRFTDEQITEHKRILNSLRHNENKN